MLNLKSHKKAQLSLFILLGVVIVALALLIIFVFVKVPITKENQVETSFLSCVDDKMKEAVSTMELQGGYLKLPTFEQGSRDYPFSNYLTFLALDIPYWSYVSGNGIYKTQKPTIQNMESQLSDYLEVQVSDCKKFQEFSSMNITSGQLKSVTVKISDNYIDTTISMPLEVNSPSMKYRNSDHRIRTKTDLGTLYKTASIIFDAQNKGTIFSNYSLDIINAYAPTTGLEIGCMPKIWSKAKVSDDIKEALKENLAEIKAKGSNYHLAASENRYFVVDFGQSIDKQVNILYSKDWPTKIEIWPSDQDTMRMDPIGNQQGLGILGFCLIPYHFVYDLGFPVMVQITSGTEIFQFPAIVYIDKMIPKKADVNETIPVELDLCQTQGQIGTVFTQYNSKAVEADISFRCLMQTCPINKTISEGDSAILTAEFPKCINGYVVAKAPGYRDSEALVSTNEPFILSISMSPTYQLDLELNLDAQETAMISFNSPDYSQTIFYPNQKKINLSEGIYNVSVQIYKPANLNLGTQEVEKCIQVPAAGIPGTLGFQTEQCYNITVPSTQFTSVPIGGGMSLISIQDSDLKNAKKIKITAEKLDAPASIEDLMDIYDLINANQLTINLA